jgi:hypothetical protein
MITPSIPTVVAPTVSTPSGGGGGGGGGTSPTGFQNLPGKGTKNLRFDFASGQFVPFDFTQEATSPTVVNINVTTTTTDGEFPNKVVEALQQYNLVSGPLDVQIAV